MFNETSINNGSEFSVEISNTGNVKLSQRISDVVFDSARTGYYGDYERKLKTIYEIQEKLIKKSLIFIQHKKVNDDKPEDNQTNN